MKKKLLDGNDDCFEGEEGGLIPEFFDDGCFFVKTERKDLDADIDELEGFMYTVRIKDV